MWPYIEEVQEHNTLHFAYLVARMRLYFGYGNLERKRNERKGQIQFLLFAYNMGEGKGLGTWKDSFSFLFYNVREMEAR